MTKKLDTTFIQIVHPVCCGLDVHKKKISACLITVDNNGKEQYEIKEFGTFTDDLVEMKNWLLNNECPVLAMESTGVYWRPVHNVLEGFMEVILVNARHIKNVPGRKTDISDSKWLAGLLRHGLPGTASDTSPKRPDRLSAATIYPEKCRQNNRQNPYGPDSDQLHPGRAGSCPGGDGPVHRA
jgi:hypothetical protein